ncbi:MAG: hypothetical protein AAFQ96_09545, partial [Pseudomonadota bacterium]
SMKSWTTEPARRRYLDIVGERHRPPLGGFGREKHGNDYHHHLFHHCRAQRLNGHRQPLSVRNGDRSARKKKNADDRRPPSILARIFQAFIRTHVSFAPPVFTVANLHN